MLPAPGCKDISEHIAAMLSGNCRTTQPQTLRRPQKSQRSTQTT
jgi:hypothetical protein